MPQVVYTPQKGLFQQAGSGIAISGNQLVGATKKVYATTRTLVLSDSGCVLAPTAGSAQTFTLPAVATAAGFCVTFIAGSAQAHVINGGGAKIQGAIFDNTNGSTLARNAVSDKSSITLANPGVGDYITVVGDGTNYYVFGWCNDTPTLA
jgi:hypothetical protein